MGKRSLSVQQFVYHDSKRPHVCLRAVNILYQSFRRHVDWRADVNISEFQSSINNLLLGEFCKAEVCDFCLVVVHEDICDLQVSVNHVLLSQVLEAQVNVSNDRHCFLFLK